MGRRLFFEAIREKKILSKICYDFNYRGIWWLLFQTKFLMTFILTPLTSYGIQKACSELMLMDYSRKGYLDGIAIRPSDDSYYS